MQGARHCRPTRRIQRETGCGQIMVMRKHQPVFRVGTGEKAFAFLDAAQWVEVVAHDPGGLQMMRGDEITDMAGVLAPTAMGATFEVHRKHAEGVPRKVLHGDTGHNLEGPLYRDRG